MDRNAAITVARALIEEMGIQPGELFPEPEAAAPAPDIDSLLPRRRWVPEMGGKYWWCDSFGTSCPAEWDGGSTDRERAVLGNVFPTHEAAAEHAANIRAWVELRERSSWDSSTDSFRCYRPIGRHSRALPGVAFSSAELRDAAVAHIGKDRVDKLICWIWGDE